MSAAILDEVKRANSGGRVHSVGVDSCDPDKIKRESIGRPASRTSRGGKDECSSKKPRLVAEVGRSKRGKS